MNNIYLTDKTCELLRDVDCAYDVDKRLLDLTSVLFLGKNDPFTVFRRHTDEPWEQIPKRHMAWRAQLDRLLGALSALHIGGFQRGQKIWSYPKEQLAVWILTHPAIEAYYKEHYPLAPPLLIQASAKGEIPPVYYERWQTELENERFTDAYRRFLHLDARFIANDAIGYFIALIDDFYVFETDLDGLKTALEHPASLRKWLRRRKRQEILEGMAAFYQFALDLNQYLDDLEFPILRGHVWLHFSYWFGNGGQRMEDVANWLEKAAAQTESQELSETKILSTALRRLRDPNGYPSELIGKTGEALAPWLESSGVAKQLSTTP